MLFFPESSALTAKIFPPLVLLTSSKLFWDKLAYGMLRGLYSRLHHPLSQGSFFITPSLAVILLTTERKKSDSPRSGLPQVRPWVPAPSLLGPSLPSFLFLTRRGLTTYFVLVWLHCWFPTLPPFLTVLSTSLWLLIQSVPLCTGRTLRSLPLSILCPITVSPIQSRWEVLFCQMTNSKRKLLFYPSRQLTTW